MAPGSLIVAPANYQIASFSTWSLTLKSKVPIDSACYIKIELPSDFTYDPELVEASNMFVPLNGDTIIPKDKINFVKRNSANGINKAYVVFEGCNENVNSAQGAEPQGRVDITRIQTQTSVKDSDTFEAFIYHDKALT